LYRVYEFKKQCQENEAVLKLLVESPQPDSTESKDKSDKEDEEFSCNITLIEEDAEFKCESECDNDQGAEQSPSEKSSKGPPYKCRECDETCADKEELKEHRKKS
jgi:hypothetical protein